MKYFIEHSLDGNFYEKAVELKSNTPEDIRNFFGTLSNEKRDSVMSFQVYGRETNSRGKLASTKKQVMTYIFSDRALHALCDRIRGLSKEFQCFYSFVDSSEFL